MCPNCAARQTAEIANLAFCCQACSHVWRQKRPRVEPTFDLAVEKMAQARSEEEIEQWVRWWRRKGLV